MRVLIITEVDSNIADKGCVCRLHKGLLAKATQNKKEEIHSLSLNNTTGEQRDRGEMTRHDSSFGNRLIDSRQA